MLKVCSFVLILVLVFACNSEAINFDGNIDFVPMFTNINSFRTIFDISTAGRASSSTYLNTRNADRLLIISTLQQYKSGSWATIKTWSKSEDGNSCQLANDWYVIKGYFYRLVSYGYVYKGDTIVENVSNISSEIYY